ncbi:MAG TPA: hypothetical protein ENK84_05330 [Desulfobulbus sp.]|nr:hypothetical protein [Desulfobulbus sp.]
MTWTLRMEQMCGLEMFTMGGKNRFMAPVRISYGDVVEKPPGKDGSQGKRNKKDLPGLRIVK